MSPDLSRPGADRRRRRGAHDGAARRPRRGGRPRALAPRATTAGTTGSAPSGARGGTDRAGTGRRGGPDPARQRRRRAGPAHRARGADPRLSEQDDVARWHSLGLAVACADLVGVMGGAVSLACDYAARPQPIRRRDRVLPGGPAHAGRRAGRSGGVAQHCAPRRVGGRRPGGDGRAGGGLRRQGLLRPCRARTVSETAIQVHGGIGNTWDCLAHVFSAQGALLRRSLRRRRRQLGPGPRRPRSAGATMDFADSAEERDFRLRLRGWLEHAQPGPSCARRRPTSTGRASGVAPDALRRRLLRAVVAEEIGGHGLPSVYEVILDEELIAGGAPPRPSIGYLVHGLLAHGSDAVQRRFLPGLVSGRERWCQGFSEPDAGSDLASLRTRARARGRRIRDHRAQGLDELLRRGRAGASCWRAPTRTWRSTAASPLSRYRCISPQSMQRPLTMINGITREFGEVDLRRRSGRRRQHDRGAGRGLAARHDRGQPRARARRAGLRRPLRQARQRIGACRRGRPALRSDPSNGATSPGHWSKARCCVAT